ncbi:uncharacterized protein [Clytia hemisphaerica]|uniref:Nucleotidyltransferase n=1 Tax=Clytia hemisphaerica TaxID=252671 RepID=A0A7M5TQ60_9CNID
MEEKLERYIQSYVDECKPSQNEISQGKKVMNNIFRLLQASRKYSIDRERLAGSTAKKTAISGHIDFDCVVFVNPQDKQGFNVKIPEVLDNFEEILISNEKFDLEEKDFRKTPRRNPSTLQVTIDDIGFDICVGLNQTYHSNHRDKKGQSVAFVERSIEFTKQKSAFAHEVARLAKFWNKTIVLELLTPNSYVSGRSTIMELIAFAAAAEAAEEEKHARHRLSHLNAFRKFLVMLRDIEELKISHRNFWSSNGIPNVGNHMAPYLIDPSDPENDLLETIKPEIRTIFSQCASTTLERLGLYEMGGINDIFEMYPSWHGNKFARWEPKNWLVGTVTTNSAFVDLKYNKGMVNNNQHNGRVKWLEKYLIPLVKRAVIESVHKEKEKINSTVSSTSTSLNKKVVKEKVESSIDEEILKTDTKWSPSSEGDESRMVTITIPYNDAGKNAIRISFD